MLFEISFWNIAQIFGTFFVTALMLYALMPGTKHIRTQDSIKRKI